MGTSSPSKGPNSRSPLVPPGTDAEPGTPLPDPQPQRFRSFRTELGKVAAGTGGTLRNALRQYASEATGGSAVGPRRFGPAYTAGADLFGVMSDLGAGGTGEASAGQDLSRLVGQPMDVAAQEISDALAPDGADRDQVRVAMQEAIAEKLGDEGIFDPTQIGMDQITALMVEFFALILFQQISDAAGEAWKRAPNVTRSTSTENDLLELVRAAMDKHLGPRVASGLRGLSRDEIRNLEKDALRDIWRMWESPE